MKKNKKVLYKATILEKLSSNEYLVVDTRGIKTTMSFPKKFLMNYINIRKGEKVYITISETSDNSSQLITKQHFLADEDLCNQKIKLDSLE